MQSVLPPGNDVSCFCDPVPGDCGLIVEQAPVALGYVAKPMRSAYVVYCRTYRYNKAVCREEEEEDDDVRWETRRVLCGRNRPPPTSAGLSSE